MSNMRKEFGGGSSGRDKTSSRRSGNADHIGSLSPYHSCEDLSAIDVKDDGSVSLVDDLSSKAAGPRVAARNTIIRHLEKFAVDAAIEGFLKDIHQCCLKTISHPKSSKLEILASVQLATLLLVTRGDELPELCDEVAKTLYFTIVSALPGTAADEVLASALSGLALAHSLYPTIHVEDGVSVVVGMKRLLSSSAFSKSPDAYPLTRAQYLMTRASVSPLSSVDEEFVELLNNSLDDASYDVVAAAVEAAAIYNESHPGTFSGDVMTHLKRVSVKEAGAEAKRNLLQLVRSFEAHVADPENSSPSETVHFRARDATITGFRKIFLLQTLRSFVRDGLPSHFAHNVAVRRLFNLTADFTAKLTKEEKDEDAEARRTANDTKEEALKDRSLARKQKHSARHQDDDE